MSEICKFCSPEELDERTIYQDDLIRSFLSHPKLARGHALVIPNRHVEPPEPVTEEESTAIAHEARRLRAAMLGSFAMGVDIWQKSRPFVPEGTGVKIDHEHTHVVSSNPGDPIYDISLNWSNPNNWSTLDLEIPDTTQILEILRP